jgi:MFS family permease
MKGIHYGWVVLGIITLVVLGALGLGRFSYSLLLPDMQLALSLHNTGAGALAAANLSGYLIVALIGGFLASKFGARVVIVAGITVMAASMIATGASGSLWSVTVWRTVTGMGSGAGNVAAMGLLSAWFSRPRRGVAAGVAVSGSGIALILTGIFIPGLLSARPFTGWRIAWYLLGGFSLLIAAAALVLLRNSPEQAGLRPLGQNRNETPGPHPGPRVWALVYRSPAVWHLGGVYAAFGFSYIIYLTFFVKQLTSGLGLTSQAAGTMFMLIGWFSLVCGILWGSISDRIGRKKALALIFAVQAVSYILFAAAGVFSPAGAAAAGAASAAGSAPAGALAGGFLSGSAPAGAWFAAVLISVFLFGMTAWSIPAVMAAACGDAVGASLASAALGFVTLFFGIGQAAGPLVAGWAADMSGSLSFSFMLAAGAAGTGAAASLMLRTGTARPSSPPA